MDKTMEVVLVLVSLLAAVAIVTSMLQGRTQGFEGFAQEQTTSSSCSISVNRLKSYCPDSGSWSSPSAQNIKESAPSGCSLSPSDVC